MKKDTFSNILLVLVLVIGLSLLLYPSFSNWWNDQHQTKAIANYTDFVEKLEKEDYSHLWDSAHDYNLALLDRSNGYVVTDEQRLRYEQELNVAGNGIMSVIEIPCIDVTMPVYHGTSDAVLQVAIGHIEWSSLPVGGENTHCVVSGHRGLPSARLFTDLDKLKIGDYFLFKTLDQVLTYEVDQILIVEPHETDALLIEEGKDLCTLVTCTPYGVNSHRLLVRGHRVENQEEAAAIRVTADAMQIEPLIIAAIIAFVILFVLLIGLLIPKPKKRRVDL